MQDDSLLQAVLERVPPADRLAALLELDPESFMLRGVPKVLVRLDCDDEVLLAALQELHGISTHECDRQHAALLHALYASAHRDPRTQRVPGLQCSIEERHAFAWRVLDELLAPSARRDYVILGDVARRYLLPLISGAGALRERVARLIAADRRLHAFHEDLEQIIDRERLRYEAAMSGEVTVEMSLEEAVIYPPRGTLEGRDLQAAYRRAVHQLRIQYGFESARP